MASLILLELILTQFLFVDPKNVGPEGVYSGLKMETKFGFIRVIGTISIHVLLASKVSSRNWKTSKGHFSFIRNIKTF